MVLLPPFFTNCLYFAIILTLNFICLVPFFWGGVVSFKSFNDFLFFSVASDSIGSAVVSFDISPSVVGVSFILVPAIFSALVFVLAAFCCSLSLLSSLSSNMLLFW